VAKSRTRKRNPSKARKKRLVYEFDAEKGGRRHNAPLQVGERRWMGVIEVCDKDGVATEYCADASEKLPLSQYLEAISKDIPSLVNDESVSYRIKVYARV